MFALRALALSADFIVCTVHLFLWSLFMLIDSSSYYVYVYFNTEGDPYYVGHGSHGRAFAKHTLPDIPIPPWKDIEVIECDSKHVAEQLEISLIKKWKPEQNGGYLLNRAIGKPGTHVRKTSERPKGNTYRYKFTTADGTVHTPLNVMQFIKEHNLSYSAVRQVAIGIRVSHKGWKVERYLI